MMSAKLDYPATHRNVGPLVEVLEPILPTSGLCLEFASGSGQHTHQFAQRWTHLSWQPSDIESDALQSIDAWCENQENVKKSLLLDAASECWDSLLVERPQFVCAINMIHIAPWIATVGLVKGCARVLKKGEQFCVYGPWFEQGVPPAPSNMSFHESLRSRNSAWGIRYIEDLEKVASEEGFEKSVDKAMPANNRFLAFTKS